MARRRVNRPGRRNHFLRFDWRRSLRRIGAVRERRYVSIFGELAITRRVYAVREKQREQAPLDSQLGLPADDFSYVLKDWLHQACVRDACADCWRSVICAVTSVASPS